MDSAYKKMIEMKNRLKEIEKKQGSEEELRQRAVYAKDYTDQHALLMQLQTQAAPFAEVTLEMNAVEKQMQLLQEALAIFKDVKRDDIYILNRIKQIVPTNLAKPLK